MNNSDKYLNYGEEDFTKDPFFRSWVLAPDDASSSFWTNWLLQYPEKEPVLENARWQLLQLTVAEEIIAKERLDSIWHKIQMTKASIQEKEEVADNLDLYPAAGAKVIPLFSFKAWQQIAAVFLIVSFCAGIFYYLSNPAQQSLQVISTAYGQTKKIILPDNSEVVLNGNSKLSFAPDWDEDDDREVKLQGEAFFAVEKKKTKGNAKFRVLTPDLVVEVLGTKFNVANRRKQTHVVLNSGKVQINIDKEGFRQELFMKPGERVSWFSTRNKVSKHTVDTELYTSWRNKKLIFNKTPLTDILPLLEDTYGYQVVLQDSTILNRNFTGEIPTNRIDLLLTSLAKLYDLEIIKDKNQLIMRSVPE